MRRFSLAKGAQRELNDILSYIAEDSPAAAQRVRQSIFQACEKLARQPLMGHRRTDITDLDVRFWNVRGRFLIVYRAAGRGVEVVRIFRAGRDVETALR
ncbi:MAG: type II toxin-antitoxin system RelE/ParE family toxin [Caulobacteraceae bacterium]